MITDDTLSLPKTNTNPGNGPLEECFPLPTSDSVVFRVHGIVFRVTVRSRVLLVSASCTFALFPQQPMAAMHGEGLIRMLEPQTERRPSAMHGETPEKRAGGGWMLACLVVLDGSDGNGV